MAQVGARLTNCLRDSDKVGRYGGEELLLLLPGMTQQSQHRLRAIHEAIGATPYDNLWLNTGHGALGFTLACGSAALLADAMAGRPSPLDASAFALMR